MNSQPLDTPAAETAPSGYLLIPVDNIKPSPHQARKDFDEEGIKGLAESIRLEGLQQAILVRPTGEGYELIAGERRLRAVKLLNRKTIEARVIQVAGEAEAAAKGLVENLQREDLNPIEEAEGFQTLNLLDPKTWTQERIGQIAGHDKSYVNRSLALLTLPEEIKKKLRARNFSRSHGIELARLPTVELQLEVSRQIPYKLTWEETRTLVDKLLGKEPRPGAQSPEPPAAVDPFGTLWTNLFKEGKFPEGTWEARYQRGGTWVFAIHTHGDNPADVLSDWFGFMAQSMPRTSPSPRAEAAGRGPVVASTADLLAEVKRTAPPELAAHLAKQYAQIEAAAKAKKQSS